MRRQNTYSQCGRFNGVVSRSSDGVTFHPIVNVSVGEEFGYSSLTQLNSTHLGLLWETSTPDCSAADASCAVKFSVVPQLCEAGGGEGACDAWRHRAPAYE